VTIASRPSGGGEKERRGKEKGKRKKGSKSRTDASLHLTCLYTYLTFDHYTSVVSVQGEEIEGKEGEGQGKAGALNVALPALPGGEKGRPNITLLPMKRRDRKRKKPSMPIPKVKVRWPPCIWSVDGGKDEEREKKKGEEPAE